LKSCSRGTKPSGVNAHFKTQVRLNVTANYTDIPCLQTGRVGRQGAWTDAWVCDSSANATSV